MRLVLTFSALAFATAAGAQTAPRPMLSTECRTEIMTLCAKADDRAARRQCMMANRAKISDGCKSELKAMRAARQGMGGGNRMGGSSDIAAPGAMKLDD